MNIEEYRKVFEVSLSHSFGWTYQECQT